MSMYETLHFADESFEPIVQDAERVLQKLLKNMVEKGSSDGSLTIKVDIEMVQDVIQNFDPSIEGETRKVIKPKLSHKVSSMLQIKDESKGSMNTDGYELVWDEDLEEYVLKPIVQQQRSIFDADYVVVDDEPGDDEDDDETPALEGRRILSLPDGAPAEDDEDDDPGEYNAAEDDTEAPDDEEDEDEDLSDDFGGYDYEQPDEY